MAGRHFIIGAVLAAILTLPAFGQAVPGSRPVRVSLTDCTAERHGTQGELCLELDDDTLYSCQPSAGLCDTAGEWVQVSGSGGSGDVTAASSFGTDNVVIRSNGTGKGVQATGVTIDDSDNISTPGSISTGGSATNVATEIAAPGAASSSGEHNWYWDSTTGRLCDHKNGASATHCFAYAFSHATDCTAVSAIDTGVSLLTGDTCHEADADTFYVYDGTAWDQLGAGGGTGRVYIGRAKSGPGTTASTCNVAFSAGEHTGTVGILAGGAVGQCVFEFIDDETDSEILYIMGERIHAGMDLTNINVEWAGRTGSSNTDVLDFEISVSCLVTGNATTTAITALTYGGTINATATATGTLNQLVFGSGTGDWSAVSNCGNGALPWIRIALDEDQTANTNSMYVRYFDIWTE